MPFYANRILPRLIDRGMRNATLAKYRPRVPPLASGRVLEIGLGSGLNIPLYTAGVSQLFGLEPSAHLRGLAAEPAARARFPVTLLDAGAEAIPLEAASVDCVVSTWTFCSIPGIEQALQEVRRVLKPDGRLLFLEHGLAPDPDVARTQAWLLPVFRGLAGCALNRPMDRLIAGAGFRLGVLEKGYLEGPRFLAYHYIGEAVPA
jgi:ubiquinone/menaquinone biosynthesis C-methylase UbiE